MQVTCTYCRYVGFVYDFSVQILTFQLHIDIMCWTDFTA